MNVITAERARAYVLRGHWVAECPARCGQVQFVFTTHAGSEAFPCACMAAMPEPTWYCWTCKTTADIDWPVNMGELWEPLSLRPSPRTRNWYPAGHDVAERARIPHGQSPADLWAENAENGVR